MKNKSTLTTLSIVTKTLFCCVLAMAIGFAVIVWIPNTFNIGTNGSDYNGWYRSGLIVHVDAATGVNYMTDGHGGICVRVRADGTPFLSPPY